jgi:hypothetical protein
MAAKHGVDVLEMQILMVKDLKKSYDLEIKTPRSRRKQQWFEVEERLSKLTPYFAGKLSNLTINDESPRQTVIRVAANNFNNQPANGPPGYGLCWLES